MSSRQLYRHFFSNLHPIQIQLKKIPNRPMTVYMTTLSGGGLSFLSQLDFPIREDVTLKATIEFSNGEKYKINGIIVRKTEHYKNPELEYGVKFNITTSEKDKLVGIVHKLSTGIL